jgi:hypothetical protein
MSLTAVYTVRDARAQLPALIASTREGQTPVIGGHRKPDAVLMSAGILNVLDLLLHSFAADCARLQLDAGSLKRGDVIHPGDPMGKAIAWLWHSGQRARLDELVSLFITTLRDGTNPRVRLTDLLAGIPMALPMNFPTEEIPALLDFLREAVPRGYREHPDEP